MKKDRIIINKSQIPYRFAISLNLTTFMLEIRYNEEHDLFTIGLYDKEGTLICIEPVIYGAELFKQHYQSGIYPTMKIVPLDESGNADCVTWDNFNETVFLIIENAG